MGEHIWVWPPKKTDTKTKMLSHKRQPDQEDGEMDHLFMREGAKSLRTEMYTQELGRSSGYFLISILIF